MAEVVFLLAAEMDVQAIYDRLEQQSDGRGDQFLRQLRELELLLASYPHLGVHVARGIRKLLMPRFDHGIFTPSKARASWWPPYSICGVIPPSSASGSDFDVTLPP